MRDESTEGDVEESPATRLVADDRPPSSLIPRPSSLLFLAALLILLIAGRSAMLRDPGSFWHVVAGEKMLVAGQVIREDPFSFTRAGWPWVADQWLAECGMAAVHRVAGWDGLLLLTATLTSVVGPQV